MTSKERDVVRGNRSEKEAWQVFCGLSGPVGIFFFNFVRSVYTSCLVGAFVLVLCRRSEGGASLFLKGFLG